MSADMEAAVDRFGLYYPYIRVRDDAWLKAAVLYWPAIVRFRPEGYAVDDSIEAQAFQEEQWLIDTNPGGVATEVGVQLLDFMNANLKTLRERYSVRKRHEPIGRASDAAPNLPWSEHARPDLSYVHVGKMGYQFRGFLTSEGLAETDSRGDPTWVGLHPRVAAAYMVALTSHYASRNNLEPVTDNPDMAVASTTNGLAEAGRLLLGIGSSDHSPGDHPPPGNAFGVLALQCVLPKGLKHIPPERIVSCRKECWEQLVAFREYAKAQQQQLDELVQMEDVELRGRALAHHISESVERPLLHLENRMRQLNLDPVRTVLTTQSLTPPLLATGAVSVGADPILATASAAAVLIGNAWWRVSGARSRAVAESPVGYLFEVRRRLAPRTIAERLASRLRR